MAVYDLEEQEKLATLKSWWDEYGKYVSGAVTVVCVIIIAVQGWRWYTRTQSEKAAVLYSAVSQGAAQGNAEKAKDAGAQLLDKYSGSAYASRAAMLLAKLAVDNGDKASAKTHLQWVIDRASEDEMKQIARLRLAYVLLDEKAYDVYGPDWSITWPLIFSAERSVIACRLTSEPAASCAIDSGPVEPSRKTSASRVRSPSAANSGAACARPARFIVRRGLPVNWRRSPCP